MKRRGLGKGLGMGYKNIAPLDSHIHSLSAKGVKTQSLIMTRKAYADISLDEENFEKSTNIRDLDWGGTKFTSIENLKESLDFVGSYKSFDSKLVYNYLRIHFPNLEYKFGREGSPVLYIRGNIADLKKIQSVAETILKADEHDFNMMTIKPNYYPGREKLKYMTKYNHPGWQGTKNILRLWWD